MAALIRNIYYRWRLSVAIFFFNPSIRIFESIRLILTHTISPIKLDTPLLGRARARFLRSTATLTTNKKKTAPNATHICAGNTKVYVSIDMYVCFRIWISLVSSHLFARLCLIYICGSHLLWSLFTQIEKIYIQIENHLILTYTKVCVCKQWHFFFWLISIYIFTQFYM